MPFGNPDLISPLSITLEQRRQIVLIFSKHYFADKHIRVFYYHSQSRPLQIRNEQLSKPSLCLTKIMIVPKLYNDRAAHNVTIRAF